MSQITELLTKRFRLRPIAPDRVSDNWVRWTGDRTIMSPMNAPVANLSRPALQRYVAAVWKSGRMIIGIYARADAADHIGLYEPAIDPRNATVTLNVLIGQPRYSLSNVLAETDPVLLGFFAKEHRIEKAIAQVVETNVPLIRHYEATGWLKEGILRQEVEAISGNRRLDVVQFGKLFVNSSPAERS